MVYSGENEPLFNLRGPRYRWVPLGQIPNVVVRAFISIEDRDFFHHRGLSFKGIARAFWINLKAGEFLQGGSTITQQLVRMNFLDSQKSWERKAKEALLAVELEQRSSKEEILEYYLNTVFLGNHSYGIEAAARRYFNKPTVELNLSEASLLAGLPQHQGSPGDVYMFLETVVLCVFRQIKSFQLRLRLVNIYNAYI